MVSGKKKKRSVSAKEKKLVVVVGGGLENSPLFYAYRPAPLGASGASGASVGCLTLFMQISC